MNDTNDTNNTAKVKISKTAEVSMKVIIDDIRNAVRPILHDSLNNIIDGKVNWEGMSLEHLTKQLNNLTNFPHTQDKKLSHYELIAELWTEHCSDAFFIKHSQYDISDVIMVVCEDKSGEPIEKFWVCKKSDDKNEM